MADDSGVVERAAVAEEVASLLRHDLRNKLASIRHASFYLQRCVAKTELWESNPRVSELFDLIVTELIAANAILEERAAFAHLFATERSAVRLGVCLADAVRSVRIPPGVSLDQSLEDSIDVAVAPKEIVLAIRCVLDNAIEAMDGAGVLTVRSFDRDDRVVVAIADTGPGFTAEQRQAGAKPLATTKPGHLGLGLCVARRIMDRFDGSILLAERAGHGLVELSVPTRAAR